MPTFDLNKVRFPKNAKELQKKILLSMGKKEEEIEPWSPIDECVEAVNKAIKEYFDQEFGKKVQRVINGQVVQMTETHVPENYRIKKARTLRKIEDAENGVCELSDDELDFLAEVFKSDLSAIDTYVFISEYITEIKLKQLADVDKKS